MISLPIQPFMWVFVTGLAVLGIFALAHVFHVLRFSTTHPVILLSIVVFILGCGYIGTQLWSLAQPIDWSGTYTIEVDWPSWLPLF